MTLIPGTDSISSVPVGKLEALLGASGALLESIFLGNRQQSLDTVTQHVHDILEAESCALFLIPDGSPDTIRLESSYTDKNGKTRDAERQELRLHDGEPKAGLTGHIAKQGRIANLSSQEMLNSKVCAHIAPKYLQSEACTSMLAIPLKDRKGRLLGLLKAENKRTSDPQPSNIPLFTQADIAIARILANKIVVVLEDLRTHDFLRGLIQEIHSRENFDRVLHGILFRSVVFMNARRGDLALWSEQRNELIVAASIGAQTPAKINPLSVAVPHESVMRRLWDSADRCPLICGNVNNLQSYHNYDSRTRSEAAVRLHRDGRGLGVLNLENFELNGFDEHDRESLQFLADYVSLAVYTATRQTQLQGLEGNKRENPLSAIEEIPQELSDLSKSDNLGRIFAAIKAIGFERSRIFRYDEHSKVFHCLGSLDGALNNSCCGLESAVEDNPYSKDLVETYLSNQRVRVYDPNDPRSLGPDPTAFRFGKAPDLPWAAAPLIVDSHLYGQVTADNGTSRKLISNESLEYLNLIAVHVSRSLLQAKRKRDQTMLRESQESYQYLVENTGHRISQKDHDGKIVEVNDAFCKSLSMKKEDIIGKTDFDLFPAKLATKYQADDRKVLTGAVPRLDQQEEFQYPGGGRVFVRVLKTPVRDADGNIIKVQVTFWEITQTDIAALLDTIPDSIYFKDNKSRFVRVSQSMLSLFNRRNMQEVIGKTDFDFFERRNANKKYRDEQGLLQGKTKVVQREEQNIFLDGRTPNWVSTTKLPLRSVTDGRIVGTLGISRDITAAKVQEQELRRAYRNLVASESRYRTLIEHAHVVVYTHDLLGGFKSINRAGEELFGWTKGEFLKKSIADIVTPKDRERVMGLLRRESLKKGLPSRRMSFSITVIDRHKKEHYLSVFTRLIKATAGKRNRTRRSLSQRKKKIKFAVEGICLDVTLREQRLQTALAEKELLLREVNHRVKNNLMDEVAYFEMQERAAGDLAAKQILAGCRERVQAALEIYDLVLSSPQVTKVSTKEYIQMLTLRLFEKQRTLQPGIRCDVDVEEFDLEFQVALTCAQIINELVTNSFRHAFLPGDTGSIMVSFKRSRSGIATLKCADDGVGLRQKSSGGVGLGIVEILVRQLGADMRVSRRTGTTFTITFKS